FMRNLHFCFAFSGGRWNLLSAFGHTSAARCSSNSCRPDSKPSENTEVVGQRILTPEFKLRLFTLNCRFWTEMPELWPFDDPYWAIYCNKPYFDLILPGDMFYDEALATSLRGWLDNCIDSHGTKDPIGDPGRLAQFELPECVREENCGLTCSSVWCYCPEM
uniref:Uncharacterized protein n=1 Tax=Gasterosteus aculeatus aculeatus TaxID=481459 RepID=A0AAQ4RZ75_GASAC